MVGAVLRDTLFGMQTWEGRLPKADVQGTVFSGAEVSRLGSPPKGGLCDEKSPQTAPTRRLEGFLSVRFPLRWFVRTTSLKFFEIKNLPVVTATKIREG